MKPFADTVATESELREIYAMPKQRVLDKEIDAFDDICRRFIAAAPIVMLSTADADGRCECSPRGGLPGFVHVVDDHRLLIPDDRGNNRLDTIRNVVATSEVGLLFLVPGRQETLRVNGEAWITTDAELLERAPAGAGKIAQVGIGVRMRTAFMHCGKALIRSGLWEPERWPDLEHVPTRVDIQVAHVPGMTREQSEAGLVEAYTDRLTW